MVDKIVLFVLIFLFAALVLSVIGSYILLYMENKGTPYTKKKKDIDNKIACRKVEMEYRRRLVDEYFWHDSKRFFWISGIFIVAITIATAFMNIIGIILGILIFIVYIMFLKWAYERYKNFPVIAKEKLEAFEKPIKDGVVKAVSFPGDIVRKFTLEDEILSEDMNNIIVVEQVVGVKKLEFPPFAPPPKRTVINERKLEYIVFTNEFVCSFTKAGTFNLLKPGRQPELKGCAEKNAGLLGPASQEHYYSNIDYGKVVDGVFTIVYKDEREFALFTIQGGKPPDIKKRTGQIMGTLKHKLRITERQMLRKVDEYAKMEYIKKLRELEKNNTEEEPKED